MLLVLLHAARGWHLWEVIWNFSFYNTKNVRIGNLLLVSCTLYNIYLDKFVGIDTYSLNSLANVLGLIQEGVYNETTLKFLNLAVCGLKPFRNPLPLAGMDRNQSPELRTTVYRVHLLWFSYPNQRGPQWASICTAGLL